MDNLSPDATPLDDFQAAFLADCFRPLCGPTTAS